MRSAPFARAGLATHSLSLTAPNTAAASGGTITVSGTGHNPNRADLQDTNHRKCDVHIPITFQ
ncbi:hypothetical protein F9278_03790 [Streptomyces phaeolivaceus]|uniref:Uncharacterized protein n=1 Tax=Streptomyces phaeolivaceus TaxID=2653200 RepID=A0A5P8JWN9_9ACTN|nr:hypothetical protein [Streptomyces phaeolivaceus]QFQ95455.1 hypothetical protein F9278_03790 [Streptomyces phaeolivaceus]